MEHLKTLKEYSNLFSKNYTDFNGHTFFYRESNPESDKLIIVVHGVTGTHYSMLQMAGVWAERGYHVVLPDMPGHGLSDELPIEHFSELGDWLNDFIKNVVPNQPLVLVGDSFGSAVCWVYAAKYGLPANSRLILGAPTPNTSRMSERLLKLSQLFPMKVTKHVYYNPASNIVRMKVLLAGFTNKTMFKRLRESLTSETHLIRHDYAYNFMHILGRDKPYHKFKITPEIAKKSTVVYGDNDTIAGKNVGKEMRELLPDAIFIEAPKCGHLVHIEAVGPMTQAVEDALNVTA